MNRVFSITLPEGVDPVELQSKIRVALKEEFGPNCFASLVPSQFRIMDSRGYFLTEWGPLNGSSSWGTKKSALKFEQADAEAIIDVLKRKQFFKPVYLEEVELEGRAA